MATPKAWNRREGEVLGGSPESLGGGVSEPTGRFLVLSDSPGGDPAGKGDDDGDDPSVTTEGPSPTTSVGIGAMNASNVAAFGSVDMGAVAQAIGAVTAAAKGDPSPEGLSGPGPGAGAGVGGSDAGSPGTGGTPGSSAGDSSTGQGMKRGGLVPNRHPGSGDDERIVVEAGEFIITKAATKKYGVALLSALNRGQLKVHDHGQYLALHRDKPAPKRVMGKARPQHTLMRGA